MNSALLRGYHLLPPVLRSAIATARGAQLRAWRYGPGFDAMRDDVLARDRWSVERWKSWQEERLAMVLHRAATRVPYYRELWSRRRRVGDTASWDYIENWPILEKEPVRSNPQSFVADDCSPSRMLRDHTSGTTGTSLDIWFTRRTVRAWYALHEVRCRMWYGVDRRDRWAILGGQLVTAAAQTAPPFWVWNAALKQLYMSAYHLAPRNIPAYVGALWRYKVRYVLAYPSALYAIAREALERHLTLPSIAVAITNAEPLLAHQRRAIEDAFSCPVRETYGMSEIAAAASECEHGAMHVWPEAGWIEVHHEGAPAPIGCTGELVATGLFNADMPLIRYRVGDRGALGSADARCSCGRHMPVLGAIEGRTDDVLLGIDGREIGRMDPVFKSALPIREAQIIQEQLSRIRVRYVPAANYDAHAGASLVDRIRERLGPVEVILEECVSLPRSSNGKFRAVVCAVPPDERPHVHAHA